MCGICCWWRRRWRHRSSEQTTRCRRTACYRRNVHSHVDRTRSVTFAFVFSRRPDLSCNSPGAAVLNAFFVVFSATASYSKAYWDVPRASRVVYCWSDCNQRRIILPFTVGLVEHYGLDRVHPRVSKAWIGLDDFTLILRRLGGRSDRNVRYTWKYPKSTHRTILRSHTNSLHILRRFFIFNLQTRSGTLCLIDWFSSLTLVGLDRAITEVWSLQSNSPTSNCCTVLLTKFKKTNDVST